MQVFVPYSDFQKSVKALDTKRLIKQSLEATQLLDIIFDMPTKSGKPRTGWTQHPALIAWKDTPGALIEYLTHNATEMTLRGCKTDYVTKKLQEYKRYTVSTNNPIWLGDEQIHSSHRARLLQKGFEEKIKYGEKANKTIQWYAQWGWSETTHSDFFNLEYYWPVNITAQSYDIMQKVSKDALKSKKQLIEAFTVNPWISSSQIATV